MCFLLQLPAEQHCKEISLVRWQQITDNKVTYNFLSIQEWKCFLFCFQHPAIWGQMCRGDASGVSSRAVGAWLRKAGKEKRPLPRGAHGPAFCPGGQEGVCCLSSLLSGFKKFSAWLCHYGTIVQRASDWLACRETERSKKKRLLFKRQHAES